MGPGSFFYGTSELDRRRGDFPELTAVNMIGEQVPTEKELTLQSRPGQVASSVTMGSGPIKGLYQNDGVLSNALFGVSGTALYESATNRGTVTGTGYVSFAGYEDTLFVNAGESIHSWNGTTFSTLSFPDSANVKKIVFGASRIIAIREDSGKIYWSDILSSTIDALSFATAENSPDQLVDLLYIGDRAILFGSETVEFWPATTDSDLPFAPLPGATFQVGCKATGLAQQFARGFAWVTNNNEVCFNDQNNIISSPDLQVKIEESSNVELFTFYVDGNEYLCVKLAGESWIYGARTQLWSTLESYNKTNWVSTCYENGYFGSSEDGTLLEWSADAHEDLSGPMERRFTAWVPLDGAPIKVGNIQLRTNPGNTPFLSGDYENPSVELRTSNDGGRSWNKWQEQSLGIQGNYRAKTVWGSMGMFGYPGILVEVRCTDPVPFRVSSLTYNEPFGGP